MLELRNFASVGRSLVAGQQFLRGEVVLSEEEGPALKWDATAPLPDPIRVIAARHAVPAFLAHAAVAFLDPSATDSSRRTVLDMCSPSLPICGSTLSLFDFSRELLQFVKSRDGAAITIPRVPKSTVRSGNNEEADDIASIVHAIMAAKVNAHRRQSGEWCLYRRASKLAHSCDPNLFYVPESDRTGACRFIATRTIEVGELLSFSYVGGPLLARDAKSRQERLTSSHLFRCCCRRCDGPDWSRQLPCPHGCNPTTSDRPSSIVRVCSSLAKSDFDAFPGKPWKCRCCDAEFSDVDIAGLLQQEATVVAATDAIEPSKLRLGDLQQQLDTAVGVLGFRHWTVAQLTLHVATFFRLLSKNGAKSAFPLAVAWAMRYIQSLVDTGVERREEPVCMDANGDVVVPYQTPWSLTPPGPGVAAPPQPPTVHMLTAAIIGALVDCWTALDLRGTPEGNKVVTVLKRLTSAALPMMTLADVDGSRTASARRLLAEPDRTPLVSPASSSLMGASMYMREQSFVLLFAEQYCAADVMGAVLSPTPEAAMALWDKLVAQTVVTQQMSQRRRSSLSSLEGGGQGGNSPDPPK
jgi:hypothetical protein